MRVHAYVDEYGDSSVNTDVPGVSSHFIISAVLVEHTQEALVLEQFEAVRLRHFQAGEMKSSKVGNNDSRRSIVLNDLCTIPFRFYAFVVDKRQIQKTGGLIYKKPFVKFLHGIVYRQLYRALPDLVVVADEHGRREFMDSFVDYVRKNHIPDLFTKAEMSFSTSKSHPLLGIADFISGSLARYFDIEKASPKGSDFVRQLRPKTILIEAWPPQTYFQIRNTIFSDDSSFDAVVKEQGIARVIEFIETNMSAKTNEITDIQVAIAKYLLYVCKFVDDAAYIPTHELRQHIDEELSRSMSEHFFRTQVIAKLRDFGLLIASSSKGYKIPVCAGDLDDFAQQAHSIIGPMLSRVQKARKQILMASAGKLDILGKQEYGYIRQLLDNQSSQGPPVV